MRMEISELTQAMHQFVRSRGWYERESPRPQTLRNLAISLNLEAAEVLEHFQWRDEPKDPAALADELADVLWYLAAAAHELGMTLDDIAIRSIRKIESRKKRGVIHGEGDKR